MSIGRTPSFAWAPQRDYEGPELTQYESWTPAPKEDRNLLDSLKLKVLAIHTEPE